MDDNNRERKTLKALLVFKIAIDRDQKVEQGSSESQQLAVFDARRADLGNGLDLMTGNIVARCAGTHSSSSTRISNQAAFACSSAAMAISRVTVGKSSRNAFNE